MSRLGYYAVGSEVALVAITATHVFDLVKIDLSHKANRVKFIIYLLRLSSLLGPLATLVGHRADPEFETLIRPDNKTVSIGAQAILKTFDGTEHAHRAAYLQAIYQNLKEKAVPNVDSPTDNFPCLLVYYVGSFIGFAGCLITDLPQVELLTPFLPFNTNTHETEMSSQLARALGAPRLAVESLKNHYVNWRQPQKDGDRFSREKLFYPYKTCYSNTGASERMDGTKLLFLCETTAATTAARRLCVKFTRKYSEAAHQYCATNGVAPELYAVDRLPGGWIMVVMEYLDEKSYDPLLTSRVPRVDFAQEVRQVVGVLHAGDFVHGDVRDFNLMVRRDWSETNDAKKGLLVDFDWARPTSSTRYPPNVNRVEIPRPDGAKDGEPILMEHDLWMVERIAGPPVGQESVPVDGAAPPMMDLSQ